MESLFFNKHPNWYDDLCEYYGVSPETALELGTRKPNRKPNLPSSPTTHAVNNLTFEEIWALKPRNSEEEIFQFYKDQGSWSSFRQVVRHKDLTSMHLEFISKTIRKDSTFCEYGCGIAPFTFTLLQNVDKDEKLNIFISDVESEHYNFGIWRLKKLIKDRSLSNVNLEHVVVLPNKLPNYPKKLDTVFIFEVLEHVPSPVATINNLIDQMNTEGILCENFIKHEHDPNSLPGCDLDSAANEREDYYQIVKQKFTLIAGNDHIVAPNQTRVWIKK